MMRDIEEDFRKRKFPSAFVYGPERVTREGYFDHAIVFERDREASDTVGPVKGSQSNPRKMRVRELCVKCTIYAQSRLEGPRINEHEAECEQIVDALVIALAEWGEASRAGDLPITESRYLKAEEREAVEVWPGVVYVLRFRVPRGVTARDYTRAARPTGAATGVGGQILVRRNADDPPEVVDLP